MLPNAYGFELYHSNAHPYMAHNQNERGFLTDLLIEAGKRESIEVTPVYVPWRRAQIIAQSDPNKLIFAVRTPKREKNYTWITPLFTMQTVIASSSKKIDSLEQASTELDDLTIMHGIALQRDILAQGYPPEKLLTLPVTQRLMTFLSERDGAGWIAQKMQIKSFWAKFGKDIPLVMGDVIAKRELWLACSLECSGIDTRKLAAQVNALKASDWFKRQKQSYLSASK